MSSVELAARALKSVKDEEWRALSGLEKASSTYGTADERMVSRLAKMPRERAAFALDSLERKGMASRRGGGYALRQEGVELLALQEYVNRDLVAALGAIIAKGKESDVYEAYTEEGSLYALKFFKLGRTSFTRVRKKRFTEGPGIKSWMAVNFEAARREYAALRKLEGRSRCFPKAYAYSRSTVLMEQVSGFRLSERPELADPGGALRTVLEAMRAAYVGAGLVNGDLSEYNILTDGESLWLIDWPQSVERGHPNAGSLLEHDVSVVVKFFVRAYGEAVEPGKALGFVSGAADGLE